MRLHFQEKPWDLVAGLGYTLIMTGGILAFGEGSILGILMILFVPGYVLTAVLFPKNAEIDWIERIALSFGLSIAVVPLLGLLLNFTSFGIRFVPIVATIAFFTVGMGYAAYWIRLRLPPDRRLSLTVDLNWPDWRAHKALDKGLTVALAAATVVSAGTFLYAVMTPRASEHFTEFYILGPDGGASGYPTRLNVSEPGTVILGIVNHESARINYTVRVDLVGVSIVFDTSCNCNRTYEANRTSLTQLNKALGDRQNWTQLYTFQISASGLWKLEFLLYKDSTPAAQTLHLFIRVP